MTSARVKPPTPVSKIGWDVSALIGRKVRIETRDGIFRNGRFDGFITRPAVFFGKETAIPVSAVVAGDEIPIERVMAITEAP